MTSLPQLRSCTRRVLTPLFLSVILAGAGLSAQGQGTTASTDSSGRIAFRKTAVDVADLESLRNPQKRPGPTALVEEDQLSEKKSTLETELRYAELKLATAQKRLAAQKSGGSAEEADRITQEAKDWEDRVAILKSQIGQLDKEIQLSSPPEPLALSGADTEIIVPGDNLEIFINEDSSFNGRYQVRRGGYLILPQIGRVPVAGKSLVQAEAAVKKALQSSQLQQATVMIERIAGRDVETGPLIYLNGEFKNPRPYRIPVGTSPTLVSVVLSSGGVTERADLTRVRVMRMTANKGVTEIVNLQKILEGGGLSSDMTLSEGDVVTIPVGNPNLVYVMGNVKTQGSIHLGAEERLTAYGAILQSGGFARFANLKDTHVLRAMPDGTKAKLPVNVQAIQRGQVPDLVLQPNDIIVVPEKWFSW